MKVFHMTNDIIENVPMLGSWMNSSNLMGKVKSITVYFTKAMFSQCLPNFIFTNPDTEIAKEENLVCFMMAVLGSW